MFAMYFLSPFITLITEDAQSVIMFGVFFYLNNVHVLRRFGSRQRDITSSACKFQLLVCRVSGSANSAQSVVVTL